MAGKGALPRFFVCLFFVTLMSWISAEKGQQRRVSLGLELGPWVSHWRWGDPAHRLTHLPHLGLPIQQVHFAVYCFFSFLSQPIKYSHLPFLFSVISWPVFSQGTCVFHECTVLHVCCSCQVWAHSVSETVFYGAGSSQKLTINSNSWHLAESVWNLWMLGTYNSLQQPQPTWRKQFLVQYKKPVLRLHPIYFKGFSVQKVQLWKKIGKMPIFTRLVAISYQNEDRERSALPMKSDQLNKKIVEREKQSKAKQVNPTYRHYSIQKNRNEQTQENSYKT